jgi:chemotaxis protein MotA
MGALVPLRDQMRYDLLRDGFSLIINDFKTEEIRHNLMARVDAKQTKMALAANLFDNMSKLCPGMGMIGTLMGLIAMLSNMNDPTKLGSGMALALITTLYGLMLGTIIYGPWGEKIHIEAEKILEIDLMVVEGVLNIRGKKSSIHMKDIVKTYASKHSPQINRGAS